MAKRTAVAVSPGAVAGLGTGEGLDESAGSFEHQAELVLNRLCRAMGQLLESLPETVRSAGDVQRVLGIDKALAWQIFRLGSVSDPIAAGPDVPRQAAMVRAMCGAEARGVPRPVLDAVLQASEAFERLVQRHAGDRTSFDAMVRGLRSGAAQIHLKERRAAYRALSSIWGIHADCLYSAGIFHPGIREGTEDVIAVSGYVGLRKLRAGAQLYIGGRSEARQSVSSTPEAPAGRGEGTPAGRRTIEEFSTRPLPPLRVREAASGVLETTLELEGVGRSSAITYFTSDLARAAGVGPQPWWGAISISRLPSEVLVMDLLVPSGRSDPGTVRVDTYGNLRNYEAACKRNEADRLPVTESIVHLGRAPERLRTPHVPRCAELISTVLQDLGWHATEFDIYRCVVQYPILYAGVATRVDAAG